MNWNRPKSNLQTIQWMVYARSKQHSKDRWSAARLSSTGEQDLRWKVSTAASFYLREMSGRDIETTTKTIALTWNKRKKRK